MGALLSMLRIMMAPAFIAAQLTPQNKFWRNTEQMIWTIMRNKERKTGKAEKSRNSLKFLAKFLKNFSEPSILVFPNKLVWGRLLLRIQTRKNVLKQIFTRRSSN